jgi:hypothetical protein
VLRAAADPLLLNFLKQGVAGRTGHHQTSLIHNKRSAPGADALRLQQTRELLQVEIDTKNTRRPFIAVIHRL